MTGGASAIFAPEFRAALIALADQAQANLGLGDAHFAMVCHAVRNGKTYDASLASDRTPALIREMRRGFPRRGSGAQRFFTNQFGALFLVGVTLADVEAARVRIRVQR